MNYFDFQTFFTIFANNDADNFMASDYYVPGKRTLGCGKELIGRPDIPGIDKKFRKIIIKPSFGLMSEDYSEVRYLFFTILYLPIIPIKCYRISTIHHSAGGFSFKEEQTERIISEEKMRFSEILFIYLYRWMIVPICLLFILFSGGDY